MERIWEITDTVVSQWFIVIFFSVLCIWCAYSYYKGKLAETPLDARNDLTKCLKKVSYRLPHSSDYLAETFSKIDKVAYTEIKTYITEMDRLLEEFYKKEE